MKGLIVKWRDKICKAGIPDSGVGLIVNVTRYDGAYWNLGGVRWSDEMHMIWNGGTLEVGDELVIEFCCRKES